MLDEKDLQAIRAIVREEATEIIAKEIPKAEQRITKNMVTLMDMEFKPKFDLLAEGQQAILDQLVPRSRVDDLEDEVKFLKSMIRRMNEELQELKKAN